ncbi:MAG TPA: hypothetical protein VNC61_06205 [Acidimicrobiales bacterium]|nr:hypothetical protein [Acidimicrobiales bacterium]
MPPGAGGRPSRVHGVWGLLHDPTAYLGRLRRRWGETFVVDAAGHRLLWVFSPDGVRSLDGFAEKEASFGLATFELIRRKVPDELSPGRRTTPHDLFGRQETERYLGNLEEAMIMEIDELGSTGQFEVFGEARRLGHRLGLGSWAGVEAASPRYLRRLVPLFDRLDGSEAFVRPGRTFLTAATGKRLERRAMHGIERVVAEIWAGRQSRGGGARRFPDPAVPVVRRPGPRRTRHPGRAGPDLDPHGFPVGSLRPHWPGLWSIFSCTPACWPGCAPGRTGCSSVAPTNRFGWPNGP